MTCSNKKQSVGEFEFEKTPYKHCTMIFDDLDFLSPMYTLISFLSIGNLYYHFVHFITFLERLGNISCMNFIKTELINHTCSSRIHWGFPRCMADTFDTTGKLRSPTFGIWQLITH